MQFNFLLLTDKYWISWLLCCKKIMMAKKQQLKVTTDNYHNLLIIFMFTSYFEVEVNCFVVNPCLSFLIRSQNKDIILNQSFSYCLSLFVPLLILEYLLTWPIWLGKKILWTDKIITFTGDHHNRTKMDVKQWDNREQ